MKLKKSYEQLARELAQGDLEILNLFRRLKDLKEQIEEESGWIVEFSAFKKHKKR